MSLLSLMQHFSYESLPPNFSLAANMAAGAFAGIAVRLSVIPPLEHNVSNS
jgi:hypothetical protein